MPSVTRAKAYLKTRQKSVRDKISQLGLDGLLLTHPPDLAYLSDFTGDDSIGLITAGDFVLVSDFRYKEQAQIEAPWIKLVIRTGKMSEALSKTIQDSGAKKIGYEANFTTVGQINALQKAFEGKKIELVPVDDVMVNIRKIKDEHEIGIIRKAISIAEEGFEAIRGEIKAGLTENHLAGLLIAELRSRGAQTTSFEPIIAAGANSSLPHYRPGEVLVKRNEFLLFDWGARYDGYCSDLTRTLHIGKISAKLKKIYEITLQAQMAAIKFLKPGVSTKQADKVARDIIEQAGFKEFFGHGLGHGIGRDIHELPVLRHTGEEETLVPGMIVTVEPGIYLPGEGGVRIEDDVLITAKGSEVLSSLDKSYEACHIE